jgi:hypothetical protein
MRRSSLLMSVLVLGGLFARLTPALAEKPCADRPILPNPEKTLSEELVAVLDQTQSPDVFLATVLVLEKVKGDPKCVIPAVLRNAERLRVFEVGSNKPTKNRQVLLKMMVSFLTANDAPSLTISSSSVDFKMLVSSLASNDDPPLSAPAKEPTRASLREHLMRWGLYCPSDGWLEECREEPLWGYTRINR